MSRLFPKTACKLAPSLPADSLTMDPIIIAVADTLGLARPADEAGLVFLQQLLELLQTPPARSVHWIRMDPEEIAVRAQLAERAMDRSLRLAQLRQDALIEWTESMSDEPWEARLERLREQGRPPLAWLRRAYWEDWLLRRRFFSRVLPSNRQWTQALEQAIERSNLERWMRNHDGSFCDRFETDYEGELTDWPSLCAALRWVERLQILLEARPVSEAIAAHVREPGKLSAMIRSVLAALNRSIGLP